MLALLSKLFEQAEGMELAVFGGLTGVVLNRGFIYLKSTAAFQKGASEAHLAASRCAVY